MKKFLCVFENGEFSCVCEEEFNLMKDESVKFEGDNEWDESREGVVKMWSSGKVFKLIEVEFEV